MRLGAGIAATAVLLLAVSVPGEAGFAPAVSYATGDDPRSIAMGDFNGDGRLDVATANAGSGDVSVLLGSGNGTFQPALNSGVGGEPFAMAPGDFNGDGRPDLVVGSIGFSASVSILLGLGNGTFQASYRTTETIPFAVAVGDFNRDGRLDVAVSNNDLSILLGNGNGTLQPAINYETADLATSIAVGDLDRDGKPDLAVGIHSSGNVSVLLGNGDGTFQATVDYGALGYGFLRLALSDFNRDGTPDLAVVGGYSRVAILLGVGNGTFQAAVTYDVLPFATSVVPGDFDGDGREDLAVDGLSILRGRGDGTFQESASSVVNYGGSLAAGDLDGDGHLDLAAAWGYTISVLLNDAGDATCAVGAAASYPTGAGPYPVAVGDFNRDGARDLAVPNSLSNTISILLGNGNGTFQQKLDYAAGSNPRSVAVGDFDRDGKPDLAVGNSGSNTVSIRHGNGDGTFQAPVDYAVEGPIGVAAGEFNGDGKPDLAIVTSAGFRRLWILFGSGDGTFLPAVPVPVASFLASMVVVSDVNGDGKTDLVTASPDHPVIAVLLGDGSGAFVWASATSSFRPESVAVGDFNRDGHPDLAFAAFGVVIQLGNGDGTFLPPTHFPPGTAASGVAVADFNRDGLADVAVASSGSGNISVLGGRGDGTFQAPVNYVATSPLALAIGDFDRDGSPDLVSTSKTSAEVSVLLGSCQFPTVTTLRSSVNPSFGGQPVTLTARVTSGYGRPKGGAPPKGTVTFKEGTTSLGTLALTGGEASLTTSALAEGSQHPITAEYSGMGRFLSSSSGPLTQIVGPTVTIDDVRITEGDSGTSQALFVVRLSAPADYGVSVSYFTLNETAIAPSDFIRASDTLAFLPGVTEREVSVTVLGDVTPERHEVFYVGIDSVNAVVVRRLAQGIIADDDTPGGRGPRHLWPPFSR